MLNKPGRDGMKRRKMSIRNARPVRRYGEAAFVSMSPLWPDRRDLWLDAVTRAFFLHTSSGPWNKCMHYWSARHLKKANLHDVLTRCCSRGSAAEYKSNIPNQITPSISMFYYLFSHKQAQESRLCVRAERRPEGCWLDGKPTVSLLWDWPFPLTVKNFILCSNGTDAGFSRCLFRP